jgi:hypothetical protein
LNPITIEHHDFHLPMYSNHPACQVVLKEQWKQCRYKRLDFIIATPTQTLVILDAMLE